MNKNYATPEGTTRYSLRHPLLTYRALGKTGLLVGEAGFGGYRIDTAVSTHREALILALQSGINLIDTSSNYGDGGSEQLIGEVLNELAAGDAIGRDEIIIVSKAGYIQGKNYEMAQARKEAGNPFPNVVKYAEGLDHCIHPDFLADQLTRSLDRLNLECIDVYLLHNPEYYLSWARKANQELGYARDVYYQRLALAFEHLEQAVDNGRIGSYGISSNTFPQRADQYTTTSLHRVWQTAVSVNPDHHFTTIQFPMNLLETGGATEANQPDGRTVLQLAQELNLAVLINRPLNAIQQQPGGPETLLRLASIAPPTYPTDVQEVSTAVDTLVEMEEDFRQIHLPQLVETLNLSAETREALSQMIAIGRLLHGQWRGFGSYQNWSDLRGRYLIPRAQWALQFLAEQPNLPAETAKWLDGYVDEVNMTLAAVTAFYRELGADLARRLQATAVNADPDWQADTLSQTAVRALRSTSGITSVLVGMRRPRYVHDILADLQNPIRQQPRITTWQQVRKHNA
jgi:aryl-alcohol dehydrogenase-like predicted oxidoreductase